MSHVRHVSRDSSGNHIIIRFLRVFVRILIENRVYLKITLSHLKAEFVRRQSNETLNIIL